MTSVALAHNPIQELVLDALEARTPLRVAGRSHWIDAGRPVAATRIASLATCTGVVDYVPGDLTITVRAGTTLDEVERVTGAEGQWLPLDPHGTGDGTIGATIATGSFGPLAHAFGRARDLVLGLEFVMGDGRVARGGGRVVKNVAGFDLVRLMTGSWGTLGIITEATLRLHSLPRRALSVALSVPDSPTALSQRIAAAAEAAVQPLALELIGASLASRLGMSARPTLLVRLGGNEAAVSAQRDALSRLGGARDAPTNAWDLLRGTDSGGPSVLRISSLPARVAQVWASTCDAIMPIEGAMLHSTVSLGIVRCILPRSTTIESIRSVLAANPGCVFVFERLPREMWGVLSPSVASDNLSRGIRNAFDPSAILNPGIMGPLT